MKNLDKGYTLVEVVVSMIVMIIAASIGGIAIDSVEKMRGTRNAIVDILSIADFEAERVFVFNRNGFICGDSAYTFILNKRNYSVKLFSPGKSIAHCETAEVSGESVLIVKQQDDGSLVRSFRLIQKACNEEE